MAQFFGLRKHSFEGRMSRKKKSNSNCLSKRQRREREEREEKKETERNFFRIKIKNKKYQIRQENKDRMTISFRNDDQLLQMFELKVEPGMTRKKLRRKIRARIVNDKTLNSCGLGQISISIHGKHMKRDEKVEKFWRPLAIVDVSLTRYEFNIKKEDDDEVGDARIYPYCNSVWKKQKKHCNFS